MDEKPDLEQYLASLKRDLARTGNTFRDFAGFMISENISEFPIFVAAGVDIAIGKPFLNRHDHSVSWNYNVSFLEDFAAKGIIEKNKVESFKEACGNPEERACIFLIIGDSGNFVFIPYED